MFSVSIWLCIFLEANLCWINNRCLGSLYMFWSCSGDYMGRLGKYLLLRWRSLRQAPFILSPGDHTAAPRHPFDWLSPKEPDSASICLPLPTWPIFGPGCPWILLLSGLSAVDTSAHFPVSPLQRGKCCILLRTGQPQSQHGLAALFQSTEHLEDICNFTPTGGYNSLLAESKSTRCQRIPETICRIVKSKNKVKWFYSHPALLPHTQMYPQPPLVLALRITHTPCCLALPPTPGSLKRNGFTHIGICRLCEFKSDPGKLQG